MAKIQRSVKSAQRVVGVLRVFAAEKRPQRAADIAKALRIPISSSVFLLTTLVETGVLQYCDENRSYFPTDDLYKLAAWLKQDDVLLDETIRGARRIYRELGEPVAITRRRGIFIEWLYTIRVADRSPQPGETRPLCQTINGIAVLSRTSDEAVSEIVAAHNHRFGKQFPIRLGDLQKRVTAARDCGYASGRSPIMPGFGAICFAIENQPAGDELLLTVQVPTADLSRREGAIVRTTRRLIPQLAAL